LFTWSIALINVFDFDTSRHVFLLAASSLSHGACGGLLFDELHDDELDVDVVVVFDGAENDDNNVDNVDDF
jgi:hypothetical protein